MTLPFPSSSFGCIVADPPWPERGGGKIKRGADRHYPLLPVPAIVGLQSEVRRVARADCHLYLWVTNNFLPAGLEVVKAWGFQYLTLITWRKLGNFGIGQYFRGQTEHCIFARRGQPAFRLLPNGRRAQGVTVFDAHRQGHSVKPAQLYQWAQVVSGGPYLEMFARQPRLGWQVWGNELL